MNDYPRLTPRQGAVFDFIYDEIDEGRPSPTLDEIAEEFDFHTTNAWRLVSALVDKGYLEREPRRHRATKITEFGRRYRARLEAEHRQRRAVEVSPAAARMLVVIREQLGQLRAPDQAAVIAELGAAH